MTQTEALKLALKALEYEAQKGNDNAYQFEREAIKAALEAKDEIVEWKMGVSGIGGTGVIVQPQRTWVGLTDEEIEQGCKESWVTEQAFQSAVWWAESKLKEKNTWLI
jgi:hypothetical protein